MNDEDARRLILIEIDTIALVDALGLRGPVMVDSDLPRDVELVAISHIFESDRILLKLRHPSFNSIRAGVPIPFLSREFEGIRIHGEGSERWTMTNSKDE